MSPAARFAPWPRLRARLRRHSRPAGAVRPEELISFARRLDPGLEDQDFAEAAQRLDLLPDRAFDGIGLSREDVAKLRERFASWPRQAQARRERQAADLDPEADI
jgi:hypothetical protein